MSPQEFSRAWGAPLRGAPPTLLSSLKLPPLTKSFLKVGLPAGRLVYDLRFTVSHALPRLADTHPKAPPTIGDFVVIGADAVGPVCIRPSDGFVFRIDVQAGFRPAPMNTDLSRLAQFLVLFRGVAKKRKSLPAEEAAGTLRASFESIDPTVLRPADSWWRTLLFEIENELL